MRKAVVVVITLLITFAALGFVASALHELLVKP